MTQKNISIKPFSEEFSSIKLLDFKQNIDERGYLVKPFLKETFSQYDSDFDEIYFSESKKNVIRGIHFQKSPKELKKVVVCIKGEVKDIFIDMRKNSESYLKFSSTKLKQNKGIYIPHGFGHGFSVLSDSAIILYLQSGSFDANLELGINPLSLDLDWEVDSPILSNKDSNLPGLDSYI